MTSLSSERPETPSSCPSSWFTLGALLPSASSAFFAVWSRFAKSAKSTAPEANSFGSSAVYGWIVGAGSALTAPSIRTPSACASADAASQSNVPTEAPAGSEKVGDPDDPDEPFASDDSRALCTCGPLR
jgi:hypothetical protein